MSLSLETTQPLSGSPLNSPRPPQPAAAVAICTRPAIEYRNDRTQSYIALERSGTQKQWKFPDAFALSKDIDTTADLVFAGYGITRQSLAMTTYQGIDAHGKIVLIFDTNRRKTTQIHLQWNR